MSFTKPQLDTSKYRCQKCITRIELEAKIGNLVSSTRASNSESKSSESIAAELTRADAMGLINTDEMSAGIERNLVLLEQHFEIVAKTLADLGSAPK